jgi:hypothetical protein
LVECPFVDAADGVDAEAPTVALVGERRALTTC